MNKPIVSLYGDRALNLSWSAKIDPEIHKKVLQYEVFLKEKFKEELLETVATYQSLTLFFKEIADAKICFQKMQTIHFIEAENEARITNQWMIPVCYDASFGWDLEEVAEYGDSSIEEIITLHTQAIYRIYFIGFLPGFLYLGGLDEKLHCPRKSTPRLKVPKGAVAIGGNQTGIYPCESPGGWQIIGQTPIQLFNPEQSPPTPFKSGDMIRFRAISLDEFEEIKAAVDAGTYSLLKTPLK